MFFVFIALRSGLLRNPPSFSYLVYRFSATLSSTIKSKRLNRSSDNTVKGVVLIFNRKNFDPSHDLRAELGGHVVYRDSNGCWQSPNICKWSGSGGIWSLLLNVLGTHSVKLLVLEFWMLKMQLGKRGFFINPIFYDGFPLT